MTTPNHKYAVSSKNYCVIMMLQNLKKLLKLKIFKKNSFLRHEVPFKAKNNREAVVVCAIHVVKRPSKRSVLVIYYIIRFHIYSNKQSIYLKFYFVNFSARDLRSPNMSINLFVSRDCASSFSMESIASESSRSWAIVDLR